MQSIRSSVAAALLGSVGMGARERWHAPKLGLQRALKRQREEAQRRAALYADTPPVGVSRQVRRLEARAALKLQQARQRILDRQERAKARKAHPRQDVAA